MEGINRSLVARRTLLPSLHLITTPSSSFSSFSTSPPSRSTIFHRPHTYFSLSSPSTYLLLTTLHTCYWSWYTLSLTPLINSLSLASDASLASVSPFVGMAGLGMAGLMNLMGVAYTKRLVSRVDCGGGKISLYAHDLPAGRPSARPAEVVGIGELRVEVPKGYSGPERDGCLRGGNGKGDFFKL
ncbi:hypothetical protein TrRE_jg11710 [Triparma retinervis]|uniref:Uncharacterized protein n=1 Tax=Triparma retinervis TaxID=2557542 RepID=A0A9W6ZA47_9STRA|nr:hypothetical protein TrRE_jg11710 [Triparma retinervis]